MDGYFSGDLARCMSLRNHSIPHASTLAHCAAVSRIERCSRRSSGAAGGLPRGRFGSSMTGSVNRFPSPNKSLALRPLLNHNKSINMQERTMAIEGTTFTVAGTSDYPVCDCCGKTNLTRAVMVANEHGEQFNVGCICASKVLRQRYQGKNLRISTAAVISIGKAAGASKEWQARNGYSAHSFELVAA